MDRSYVWTFSWFYKNNELFFVYIQFNLLVRDRSSSESSSGEWSISAIDFPLEFFAAACAALKASFSRCARREGFSSPTAFHCPLVSYSIALASDEHFPITSIKNWSTNKSVYNADLLHTGQSQALKIKLYKWFFLII